MTYKIDEAIKEITATLRSLESDAVGHAKDELADDPAALAKIAFDGTDSLTVCLNGVGCKLLPDYPPLTVLVMDLMEWKPLMAFDEIQDAIIESHVPRSFKEGEGMVADLSASDPITPEEREAIDTAIRSLQSGIDRLRAYEAERLKAQS